MVAIGVSASIKRLGKTLIITMDQPDKHSVLQLSKPIKNGETQNGLLVLDDTLTFIPNDPPYAVIDRLDGEYDEEWAGPIQEPMD